MLSGKTPFQTYSRKATSDAIMQRIRGGEFSFNGPQWNIVSDEAKEVICGLLTVEPRQRISMQKLLQHPWLRDLSVSSKIPLMTPDVLSSLSSPKTAHTALNLTMVAFNNAVRTGFCLQDVSAAPLAQRRKQKKSSTDVGSSSSLSSVSSNRTSYSCFSSSEKDASQRMTNDKNSRFDFCKEKVSDYLSTLPRMEPIEGSVTWIGERSRKHHKDKHEDSSHRPATRSYKRKQDNNTPVATAVSASQKDDDCVVVAEIPPPPRHHSRKVKKAKVLLTCW